MSPRRWLEMTLGEQAAITNQVLGTIALVVSYFLLRSLVHRLLRGSIDDPGRRYRMGKTLDYLLLFLLGLLAIKIWFADWIHLASFLGLVAAALLWILREPLLNFAGWTYIVFRRPFAVGDRVQVGGGIAGDVVDVGFLDFTVMEIEHWVDADQSTGRVVHVPNGALFTQPLANYVEGFPFLWNELAVTVTFESDWERARELLLEIVEARTEVNSEVARQEMEAHTELYHVKYQHLSPIVWVRVVEHGIRLTLRYLCRPRKRRSSESGLWEEILEHFSREPDIRLAYPTTRFFEGPAEGERGGSSLGQRSTTTGGLEGT